jgi:hypothetical protein
MQDQHERAVAIPSSYGAPGSGPGVPDVPDVNDTIESENLNAPAPHARPRPGFDDAHDTPEESA